MKRDPDACVAHKWEVTGKSPITGEEWENCKHCDLPKEKFTGYREPLQSPTVAAMKVWDPVSNTYKDVKKHINYFI